MRVMLKRKQKIKITENVMQDQSLIMLLNATHINTQFVYNDTIILTTSDDFDLYLPNNLIIKKHLYIVDRPDIFELPYNLVIKGTMVLNNTSITKLSNIKCNLLIVNTPIIIDSTVKFKTTSIYTRELLSEKSIS